jgi:signal transduction histidine kinase
MPQFSRMSIWALYLICYVGLDWISYIYAVQPLAITPWNPPPALSLFLLLKYGLRNWPVLFLAALLAEVLVRETPVSITYVLLSSAILTLAYLSIAAILVRVAHIDTAFRSLRDLTWLTIVSILGAFVVAAAYVSLYAFAGAISPGNWINDVLRFWLGDLIGIIVLTPFLLLFFGQRSQLAWLRPNPEAVLQFISILVVLWITFELGISDNHKFYYSLFLPLIWIAMRHGVQGAAMAIMLLQAGLIVALLLTGQQVATVLDVQYLMLALAISGLYLGMAVSERQSVQNSLNLREMELNQALRFAGAAEMTSAMAHELNQPLAAISNYVGACQMMLKSSADVHPLLRETMDKVGHEVNRAADSVHRLRDFFRFGTLHREKLSPETLLRESMRSAELYSTQNDVNFSFRLTTDLPQVWADRVQIEIVLHNLILNAIQAVAVEPVERREVVLEARAPEDTPGWIEFTVQDFGPGVAQEVKGGLFYAFATTKTEGMGLGLAISRSLIEAHGGKLWLDKSVKRGARFCFTLPTEEISEST